MKTCASIFSAFIVLWAQQTVHASFVNGADDKRQIYKAGEPPPPMSNRKSELVPGTIPPRVRYMFADNVTMNSAAEILRNQLESGDSALFKDSILVQPGAFRLLKDTCKLGGGSICL